MQRVTTFTLDAGGKIRIRTRAEGMLAALAHDLEIETCRVIGRAEAPDEQRWSATLTVDVSTLRVAGVLKGNRVETNVLSGSDIREIERKLERDVMKGAALVRVEAEGASRDRGRAVVMIGSSRVEVPTTLQVDARDTGFAVTGRCELSLRALGIPTVKAPFGAFKVADRVEVLFDLVVVPATAE